MLKSVTKVPHNVAKLQMKIKLPEKFKGTIVEKWTNYWKNLFIDYRQMLKDLRTDIQEEPKKALLWSTGIATAIALCRNNPDELDYRNQIKKITNEVILVSEECRNVNSLEHLNYVQRCYNEGVIHYANLGILSFMYITDLNDSCDLFKNQCSYLKPSYLSLYSRIVDVGFIGKWWNLHIKTTNYDVNI
ncbi:mitochondrial import inner membrane translocase subunit Tim29 [Danaus plexippus]|nr:mitochondrial import inner membrane translocase subunit Tim29 [Danaus plexippus]